MDREKVANIIEKHNNDPSHLIQILLEIQAQNRWIPKEALDVISEKLRVPISRIQHVATFYKAFSLVPKGRHEIHICMGTACHVRGAPRILEAVQNKIGINPGETDMDLRFSLETVNCLGCCALGPVMEINGKSYGRITPSEVSEVIDAYE